MIANNSKTRADYFEQILLQPWVGGIIAIATILGGSLASFFTDDIKSHYVPLIFARTGTLSVTASSFWLTVFFVGFTLGGAQWAQNRAATRSRKEMSDQAISLEKLIGRLESLPPETFLTQYQVALRRSTSTAIAATSATTVQQVESAIRNVLGAILELSRQYDKCTENVPYCANIMIFKDDGVTETKSPIALRDVPVGHPDFKGCLELIPTLSTTTTQPDFAQDPNIVSFVMHIPKEQDAVIDASGNVKHPVLPGAPWAFVYKEFAGFVTIKQLNEWLENKCSVDEAVKREVRSYFANGDGKLIRSFSSMPILNLDSDKNNTPPPLGVLNIHKHAEGLLEEKGGERFSPLLEPFRLILSILLITRNQLITSAKP